MLTKLEKRVLKFCVSHSPEGSNQSKDILDAVDCSLYELYLCCKRLEKNGYIEESTPFLSGDFTVELTHEGLRYNELSWLEVRSFLIKSIFVPIAVSFFTTLFIWIVQSKLG